MAAVCVHCAHNIDGIKFLRCMQKWSQLILEAGAVTSSKKAGRSLPKLKANRRERGKTMGQWRCCFQPPPILKLGWKAGLWRWLGEDHPRYFELFRDGLMEGEVLWAIALGVPSHSIHTSFGESCQRLEGRKPALERPMGEFVQIYWSTVQQRVNTSGCNTKHSITTLDSTN